MRLFGRSKEYEDRAIESTIRSFQSATGEIRERRRPWQAQSTVHSLAGMLSLLIVLSVYMPLDRVVTSIQGQIVTTDSNIVLQPLDLSIIRSINVQEGDHVRRGQLIASLDPTMASADVLALQTQIEALDAQIARCEAELADEPYAFRQDKRYGAIDYAALQNAYYDERKQQYNSQIASFSYQISVARGTVEQLSNDLKRVQERVMIAQKIDNMWKGLKVKDSASSLQTLTAQDSSIQLIKVSENDRDSIAVEEQQTKVIEQNRETFRNQWKAQVSQELVIARTQRDNLRQQLEKAEKHKDLVQLEAPDDALVLKLEKRSVGSILQPGEPFAELALLNSPVEAEILIDPRDVGFVRPGDRTVVKLDPFNYVEHGWAEGTVRWVSQGTFTIPPMGTGGAGAALGTSAAGAAPMQQAAAQGAGASYYKARIAIDKVKLVNVPPDYQLMPGATLSADIHVGTRSAFYYFVSGAIRSFGEAMREP